MNNSMEDTNVTSITNDTYIALIMNDPLNKTTNMNNNLMYNETTERYTKMPESDGSHIQFWNLSESTTYPFLENSSTVFDLPTTAVYPSTTTVNSTFDEFGPPEGIEYIFVPLGVVVFVLILSAVVLIISRKRKLERLRHRLMPMYNFDPGEGEEDDWETELLDENYPTHQRRQGYQSMDTDENAELFGTY